MNLRKAIVHELVKEQHQDIQESRLANDLLPIDNIKVQNFAKKIIDIYGKRQNSAQYGVFNSLERPSSFGQFFNDLSENIEDLSDLKFIELTEFIMGRLWELASDSTPASGGYIVFLEYEVDAIIFLLVAMVKKTDGMNIDDELHIESLEYIDLAKLTQALKINTVRFREFLVADEVEKSEITYLSFVSPRNNVSTAGYFVTALGCDKGPSSAKAAESLFTASDEFFRTNPLIADNADEMHSALLEYVISCSRADGGNVRLSEVENIARRFVPAEDQEISDTTLNDYITFLNNEDNRVPVEFPVNKKIADKYSHISYKDDDYQISIKRDLVSKDEQAAVYLTEDGKVIFNRPPQELVIILEQALNE
ncbi:nucleoid-associated protein [Marinomonas dokdonensis]|uniref:nucleoid-associated protein n=1 Tax=Marinomonas dokdonensis TaxID=328224 RepID=UPI0040559B2A